MQVALITGPRKATIREYELPPPHLGAVRIRMEGCAVCASSLALWEGRDWFDYPRSPGEPGHEGWGRIDALGEGVDSLHVGQRVAVLSYHAFAEYDVADEAAVAPLPAALDDVPFPGEPIGCAMNVFRRAAIEPGHAVAIVGIGFLGALLTRLAAETGATVIAISRRPFSLDVARRMGATEALPLDDSARVLGAVRALTAGRGCDCVIEAAGIQRTLDLASRLTRERGRLVIAGFHQDGPRWVDVQLWNWRGLDVINAHEREPSAYMRGIRDAIEAVARGRIDPTSLYTHRFRLDELGAALDAVRQRPDGFLKALVVL